MVIRRPRLFLEWRAADLSRKLIKHSGLREARLEVVTGRVSAYFGEFEDTDYGNVARLRQLTRHPVSDLSHYAETPGWQAILCELAKRRPKVLVYAGSGLSYEAGIPPLSTVHQMFGVESGTNFCLEPQNDDLLSFLSIGSFGGLVTRIESFHTLCWSARPSESHFAISDACLARSISCILTDNIDFVFERGLQLETVRTRGDGLISGPFAFPSSVINQAGVFPHVLLVVGISADRRQIVRRLSAKIPTIVINPGFAVSPHSKNLDYLADLEFNSTGRSDCGHVFVKRRAKDCLPEVLIRLKAA